MSKIPQIALLGALALGICFLAKTYAADIATKQPKTETIVLAGGCFWGVESVFEHTKGVREAVSGYAGGLADTAHYEIVSDGGTGHAESVRVTYDPAQISLPQLLDIYFRVAHDPTQLDHQGPDYGTQYRSAIFYTTPEQQKIAAEKIADLNARHVFSDPVVTKLEPLNGFYPAEDYHQHYAARHPAQPYIVIYDAPKLTRLKKTYPDLYQE